MIKLENDSLSFTFPEIAAELRPLLERHLKMTGSAFRLPEDRSGLFNELCWLLGEEEPSWEFRLRPMKERPLDTARALTASDVESALQAEVLEAVGKIDDRFASLNIDFQRTLRIPDDGRTYPLPAGLGTFPLRSVDDFTATAPEIWIKRGGVAMPMYQSEALWIQFSSRYPFAVKVGFGKIDAISGEAWASNLQREPQNYVIVPRQPWLDGFAVGEGLIRQFVAMPLGEGYTAEEQLTGKAEIGGLQLQVYPMSADYYFHNQIVPSLPKSLRDLLPRLFSAHLVRLNRGIRCAPPRAGLGLGAGGRIRQEIYRDPYPFEAWDQSQTSRCFVHLCNSMVWREIIGTNPPHPPLTAREYKEAGIPWFDYYRDDMKPLKGSKRLGGVKSVTQLGEENGKQPLPENASINPNIIIQYGNTRRPGEIREFLDNP